MRDRNFEECFPEGRSPLGSTNFEECFPGGRSPLGSPNFENVFLKGDPLSGAQISENVFPKGDPLSDNQGYVPPLAHNQGLALSGTYLRPIGPFVGFKGVTRALFSGMCGPAKMGICLVKVSMFEYMSQGFAWVSASVSHLS